MRASPEPVLERLLPVIDNTFDSHLDLTPMELVPNS
jgi:hypothetical protein